ncbi:TPA_exp: putative Threonine aldolase [Trichophyton benhamiae CBS 112371]|uniref:Threonine aldolase, putative n=1 Tax=Arthroderma benhamiae (strain ATCC MYA-4681 / CBS 112371) TaxID=663331 RepID=D4B5S4_ARTBC|nr:threonine aldolase, putative [Trichophyton benhamiae CBS 112371]EFE29260.1 threonine aldolase, putative [Trichophyton benhamiae CBS 112371]DAA72544.1 TPA_exp: putative Threonine aldolase [Trichophyton benhamiae CBS 112371]
MSQPKVINLKSDTQSLPTEQMKQFMIKAELGDEQHNGDPTTAELCKRVAKLLGKEDAVFLPSGTMCNQIAINVHCRPGDEIVCERTSHIVNYETGGPAANSGVMIHAIDGERGIFTAKQLKSAIRAPSRYFPESRLLCVEQTANLGGGAIWPLSTLRDVAATAKEAGMATHMDGARLFNAVAATGISAAAYAESFDSVWIDLSKGLGCPIGAVLCGSADFIRKAWRLKQRFGGAMRQSGIIAAAGLYALDHNIKRLSEDHENARLLAKLLSAIPSVSIKLDEVETNLVYFEVNDGEGRPAAADFVAKLQSLGVKGGAMGPSTVRFATYLNVSEHDIRAAIPAIKKAMASITEQ